MLMNKYTLPFHDIAYLQRMLQVGWNALGPVRPSYRPSLLSNSCGTRLTTLNFGCAIYKIEMLTHVSLDCSADWRAGWILWDANFSSLAVSWSLPSHFLLTPTVVGCFDLLGRWGKEWSRSSQQFYLDLFFQQHKLIGELEGFIEQAEGKKGCVEKERVWKNFGGWISLSQHQYPVTARGAERSPWILKAGESHTAFWKHPLGQQNHREEWLQGGCRLMRPQEASQWFFVAQKQHGSSWRSATRAEKWGG